MKNDKQEVQQILVNGVLIKEIRPDFVTRVREEEYRSTSIDETLPINEEGIIDDVLNVLKTKGMFDRYLRLEQQALEINPNFKRNEACLALVSWCYYLQEKEEYNSLPTEEQLDPLRKMPKPFCLLTADEIERNSRKIGLKTKGDVFTHPERKMPMAESVENKMKSEGLLGRLCMTPRNDNAVKEMETDAFNKASDDLKTRWARSAKAMYEAWDSRMGEEFELEEENKIVLAMEFACRSTGIPIFEGDYANPEFIKRRMDNYQEGLLWEEIQALLAQNEDSLSKADADSIEINSLSNNPNGMLETLLPTLESLGLIEAYKEEIGEREAKSRQNQKVGEVHHPMNIERKLDLARFLIKQVKV
ncbi:MAG: hypothetical protein M0R32_11235 [Candidatus Cloacimonetes bacterium]|nr:hypothetical protein [Candidatus Cloacimonadota bacterium]